MVLLYYTTTKRGIGGNCLPSPCIFNAIKVIRHLSKAYEDPLQLKPSLMDDKEYIIIYTIAKLECDTVKTYLK